MSLVTSSPTKMTGARGGWRLRKLFVRAKAAWRCAARRSPKHAGAQVRRETTPHNVVELKTGNSIFRPLFGSEGTVENSPAF
jgi:hypothetical protein